ncbi:hypothetical protein BH09BAC1_BH09BAC1_08940 [soil metagenome]
MTVSSKTIFPLFLGLLLLFACNKPTLDDEGLLPDDQLGLYFTDTLTVYAEVMRDDSVRTDELSKNIWGAMNDPVFGKSYGGVFFQMSTDRNNIDLGSNLTLDSLVLTLLYSDTAGYGNIATPQNLKIYRVTEPFFKDTSYYQFNHFQTAATPVATINGFVPNTTDSLVINDSVKYKAGLRVRLDDALGNDILANSGLNNLASDAAFKAFFNGLYLAPDTTAPGDGLVSFNLFAANSKLTLYYGGGQSFDFLINANSASVNYFRHDYTGTPVQAALDEPGNNNQTLYIQPLGGTIVRIMIPHIDSLKNISINKAELVFTNVGTDTVSYKSLGRLILTQILSTGVEGFLQDNDLGFTFAGGAIEKENDAQGNAQNVYKLNIPRYLQQVIRTGKQYGLNLLPYPTATQANRAVLGGAIHGQHPLKLRLTYTKLD